MQSLLRIQELEKQYRALLPPSSELQKKLDQKIRLEFNYNSNHMEGNTLTYSETELLLIFDDTKGTHTLREYEEMKGSDVAYQLVQEWSSDDVPLTEQRIKSLNEILLVRPFWKDAVTPEGQETRRLIKVGTYKEHPNSVRLSNGEIFEYASVIDTPILMAELIQWYREESEKKELHPAVLAAMLHYKFVRIHPFDDGNGRTARLLMNYVLLKFGLPPVVIKSSEKRAYLTALNRADTGDLQAFCDYILDQLEWSLRLSIKAYQGENIDEPGDLDKRILQLKQKLNAQNEVVKIRKSKEAISEITNKIAAPLFNSLVEKLSALDSLFKSRTIEIHTTSGLMSRNIETAINLINSHLQKSSLDFIQFEYSLDKFRKGDKMFGVKCHIFLEFHANIYEISADLSDVKFSKLYHEILTVDETERFIESIGMGIVEQIDRNLGA